MDSTRLGLVAIGRNEGERLRRCLQSLVACGGVVVYVDSGSTDGSVAMARELGVTVVELDLAIPFTAARARNEGLRRLLELVPAVQRVLFVDGDCEVADGWTAAALAALDEHPEFAIVFGRRRERFREQTIYNRLADMEWDGHAGEVESFGGDMVARADVLRGLGGYNPTLIAAEDSELAIRARQAGHRILRLDRDMTWHDVAMTRFGQWWKRMVRSGYAYAEVKWLHRTSAAEPYVREVRSIWLGGVLLPALAIALAWPTWGASIVALVALYGVWALRTAFSRRRAFRDSWADAWLYGVSCVLGKFPLAQGQFLYWRGRWTRRAATLIEYKGAHSPASR